MSFKIRLLDGSFVRGSGWIGGVRSFESVRQAEVYARLHRLVGYSIVVCAKRWYR